MPLAPRASAETVIGSTIVTLYPIADSYVSSENPDTNYGNATSLILYINSRERYAYTMFDLSSIPSNATILSGTLWLSLRGISGFSASIGAYHCNDTSWTELGITWNNKPSFAPKATGTCYFYGWVSLGYYGWSVTADVKAAFSTGKLTEVLKFVRSDLYTSASFGSRETTYGPELVVVYVTAPVYDVRVESVQDTGATSNVGTIAIADMTLTLLQDVDIMAGSYQVTYNSGYVFVRWETTGGVSVSNPYAKTTIVTVSGSGTLRAVGNARKIEYFYDDGKCHGGIGGSQQRRMVAVRFTPVLSDKLLTARFYIYHVPYDDTIKVHVMDTNWIDLITPFNQTLKKKDEFWFDVDLSAYGLTVNAGVDFYIGMEWTHIPSDPYAGTFPLLGCDSEFSYYESRSWDWNGTAWKKAICDYIIRAVVGTPSTIACAVSLASIVIGSNVTVSGSINPAHDRATVTLRYTRPDGSKVTRTTTTDAAGFFSDTYTPDRVGSWRVWASWPGDEDHIEAASPTVSFTVSKASSSISCSLSSSTIFIGENVTISGSVSQVHPAVSVYIQYSVDGGKTWNSLTSTVTDSRGTYSYTWFPSLGSYLIRSYWAGDEDYQGATSSAQSLNVRKIGSIISCAVNPASVTVGSSTTVSGSISPSHTAPVTIRYSTDGGFTWIILTTITSQPNGSYSKAWTPLAVSTYKVKASWAGDGDHEGAESPIQTLAVKASSTISCSVSPERVKKGETAPVSGSISPLHAGVTVTLTYKRPDGSTFKQTLTTTSTGMFSDTYKPETAGSWSVTASWEGDQDHNPATSTAFIFTVEEEFPILLVASIAIITVVAIGVYFFLKRR